MEELVDRKVDIHTVDARINSITGYVTESQFTNLKKIVGSKAEELRVDDLVIKIKGYEFQREKQDEEVQWCRKKIMEQITALEKMDDRS